MYIYLVAVGNDMLQLLQLVDDRRYSRETVEGDDQIPDLPALRELGRQ